MCMYCAHLLVCLSSEMLCSTVDSPILILLPSVLPSGSCKGEVHSDNLSVNITSHKPCSPNKADLPGSENASHFSESLFPAVLDRTVLQAVSVLPTQRALPLHCVLRESGLCKCVGCANTSTVQPLLEKETARGSWLAL